MAKAPPNVLVVDDEETIVSLLCKILEDEGYSTVSAHSGEAAMELFASHSIDVVVTDIHMGGMDGLELLGRLKDQDSTLNIIVVTGHDSYDAVLKALQRGAYDYLRKPIDNHDVFLAAVERAAGSTRLLRENANLLTELGSINTRLSNANQELIDANEKLKKMASTDVLTMLFNRRYFQDAFKREVDRRNRYKLSLSVVLIDIDHFKQINDTYGHGAGDTALIKVGSLISESARTADIVARYGGEEFAVVLPETTPDSAVVFAERTRALIEEHVLIFNDQEVNITISLGIAGVDANAGAIDRDALIKAADEALYEAKDNGRNCYVEAPGLSINDSQSKAA